MEMGQTSICASLKGISLIFSSKEGRRLSVYPAPSANAYFLHAVASTLLSRYYTPAGRTLSSSDASGSH